MSIVAESILVGGIKPTAWTRRLGRLMAGGNEDEDDDEETALTSG